MVTLRKLSWLTFGSLFSVALALHVAGPEGEVVPEQLHDQGRVLVALLRQRVQLGDRVVESGLVGTDFNFWHLQKIVSPRF